MKLADLFPELDAAAVVVVVVIFAPLAIVQMQHFWNDQNTRHGAVVMAQWAERSLPTPVVRGGFKSIQFTEKFMRWKKQQGAISFEKVVFDY